MKTYKIKLEGNVMKQENVETCDECEGNVKTFCSYCPRCEDEIDSNSVTFEETCNFCKTQIKWICKKCLKLIIEN